MMLCPFVPFRLVLVVLISCTVLSLVVEVQAQAVEARIASTSGGALRFSQQRSFSLAKGDVLQPGDEITTGNGRVVIQLSDGSVVTVQPNSRIVMRDYRNAPTLRELLQVVAGRVRVRINHYGNKPNPYRVNSPSASILVRGTEFSVAVEPASETQVIVYEGLVEVVSLVTAQRAMVQPGRGVIVPLSGDIRFFTPGPGSEIGDRSRRGSRDENHRNNNAAGANGVSVANTPGDVRRNLAGDYERYIDSVVEPGESPPFLRFLAFPDSHFDSLENPAYATEFRQMEGRFSLLPSWSKANMQAGNTLLFGADLTAPNDSGILFQQTFFAPLQKGGESRTVLGGIVGAAHSTLGTFTSQSVTGAITPAFPTGIPGTSTGAASTDVTNFSASLLAAHQWGKSRRTSLGLGVDHTSGVSTLQSQTALTNLLGGNASEALTARAWVERSRLRVGITRDFGATQKLGVFYRHGVTRAEDRDQSRLFNGAPLPLDFVRFDARTKEVGMRLRGLLTRRLFYGVDATWLHVGLKEQLHRSAIVDATERERIRRAAIGGGLGYALRPRTVFGADVAVGSIHIHDRLFENATGNQLEDKKQRLRFTSLHVAAQTDVWRQMFVSLSSLTTWQWRVTDEQLFPDRFGRRLNSYGRFVPNGRTNERFSDTFTDVGLGWRLRPNLLVEYIASKSSGHSALNHVILLRYTFRREQ